MRIGEALVLQKNDVDLKTGIITVRQFKKMPMRLIPVSPSTLEKLTAYHDERSSLRVQCKESAFFLNRHGRYVTYAALKGTWNHIVKSAGLISGNKIPRIHDLRHTFACKHLLRAYREKLDIDDAIYMLSVYLGHTVIGSTYWYLSASPELLEICVRRVEKSLLKSKKGGGM